jgi:hypothetical protein
MGSRVIDSRRVPWSILQGLCPANQDIVSYACINKNTSPSDLVYLPFLTGKAGSKGLRNHPH